MSSDGRAPPASETIHLPRPSAYPLGVGAGVALVVTGLFTGLVITVIGGAVALRSLQLWLRQNSSDIARLPARAGR
jgi:hypothetical protein